MTAMSTKAVFDAAEPFVPEPPRPLRRELSPADPFPIDTLGDLLAPAAQAIHSKVQAPLAVCGQSVLTAATLAVQGHADVELPTGQARPVSSNFITIAGTGERKTLTDAEALWPIRKHEQNLRSRHEAELPGYLNARDAWAKQRDQILANRKEYPNPDAKRRALDELGPAPVPPLNPMVVCPEPTFEGLERLFPTGQPSMGVFSGGGQFIGGYGMRDDSKLRTAAALSGMWDGEPIRRVRAGDGAVVLPGRRLALHLMVQPEVANLLLSDRLLAEQGLLSRLLVTAPDTAAGTRFWREVPAEADFSIAWHFSKVVGCRVARIKFLGCWDTVASVLVPRRDRLIPQLLTLPNTRKNPSVEVFRHAMAIDERRRMFRLNRWVQPQPFIRNPFDRSAPPVQQDIKQVWFAGAHADIGGGYAEEESGLAKFPLDWMICEATMHGLSINSAMRNHVVLGRPRGGAKTRFVKPNAAADDHNSLTWGWRPLEWVPKAVKWREWQRPKLAGFYLPRAEPRMVDDGVTRPVLHQSVVDRTRLRPYAPPNLRYTMSSGTETRRRGRIEMRCIAGGPGTTVMCRGLPGRFWPTCVLAFGLLLPLSIGASQVAAQGAPQSPVHRVGQTEPFDVKTPSSAWQVYGRNKHEAGSDWSQELQRDPNRPVLIK